MIRVRFHTNYADPRPVKAPAPYPFWVTGYSGTGEYATVVAYVDDQDQLLEYWPDADHVDAEPATEIKFTDRFPKPDWWVQP